MIRFLTSLVTTPSTNISVKVSCINNPIPLAYCNRGGLGNQIHSSDLLAAYAESTGSGSTEDNEAGVL
jgi:hypothetical protein